MKTWTLQLYLIYLALVPSKSIEIYLNSHLHCDKTLEVTLEKTYLVRADVSPDTETSTFRDCEVVFHAQNVNGQLCIVQEGELSMIKDSNVEFQAYDGFGDTAENIFTLEYYPSVWNYREHCTQSSYITLYLRRKNKNIKVNIQNIWINFHIIDIESKDRRLYMDDDYYCSVTYHLHNSWVSVYNRQNEAKHVTVDKCGLRFEKETGRNTSICFLYTPMESVKYSRDWNLSVSKEFKLAAEYIIYQLKWDDAKAKETHAWCANGSIDSLVLILERTGKNFSQEPKQMFQVIATDHSGTEESLMQSLKHDNENDCSYVYIIVVILVIVLMIAFVVLFKMKNQLFKKMFFGEYTRAHNPGGKESKKSEFNL
ncbi:unnamed protein product [Lymnaea stagnalis]|uniref:Uncharacterized protein n=1 Tax=Lymnaea stagnalis TaxID=6523 RepID=A0AAV2HMS2_LYMST